MERASSFLKKNIFARTIILSVLCLGLNLILSLVARLVNYAYLPFYFDSVGTILAAMTGGALPAVLVGFATNAINSVFTTELTLYYGTISVLIALLARYFYLNGFFKSVGKRFVSATALGVLSGVLGGILTWIIYGYNFGAEIS